MTGAKPQLLCWTICDAVHIDPATGKHYLLGCFSNIQARSFPVHHPRMIWFLTLTDVHAGPHQLRLLFGRDVTEARTLVERTFESESPLHKINLINEIRNVHLEGPGLYAAVVEIDDEPILVTNLGVS
jgi:hypothetical protein